jgi:hypothetical protein
MRTLLWRVASHNIIASSSNNNPGLSPINRHQRTARTQLGSPKFDTIAPVNSDKRTFRARFAAPTTWCCMTFLCMTATPRLRELRSGLCVASAFEVTRSLAEMRPKRKRFPLFKHKECVENFGERPFGASPSSSND